MKNRLLIAASGFGAERLLASIHETGGSTFPGVRLLALGDDPERALLKLIESVDLLLPREVVCIGLLSSAATKPLAPRLARNGDRASGPLDPSGPGTLGVSIPPGRWAGATESEAPESPELNRLVYGLLRYASLRGKETWFQREPPAGLDCRTGCLELPKDASPASLRELLSPDILSHP